jgi:N-methylhydantoinase B/oxoprolinase/acetone carboxylase alpha subunit
MQIREAKEKFEIEKESNISGGIKLSFQVEIPQIIIRDLGESFSNVGENNMEDFMEAVIKITEDCSESVTKKWKTTVYTIRKYLEKG